jgi:hypothetical protein
VTDEGLTQAEVDELREATETEAERFERIHAEAAERHRE